MDPASTDDHQEEDAGPLLDSSDQDQGQGHKRYSLLCDPYRNVHRFVVLGFICFLSFGNYFCYDNAAALEDNIMEDMEVTASKYGLLYTVYSWPNVALAFFGGYLMDRVFGLRWGAIIFAGFIMLGQVIFACGALAGLFNMMIAGRLIFAIGGESLAVAQNMYAVKWFRGKELNMVFGIQVSFSRIGSTVNMYVMKPLYGWLSGRTKGHQTLGLTLLFGGGSTTVFSFLCALVLMALDKRHDRIIASGSSRAVQQQQQQQQADVIQVRDVLRFPASFWLLSVVCVTYYVAIFPFVAYGLVFFASKYQMDGYSADVCNSLIYLISIGASPLCGLLVDRTGRNVLWVMASIALTALAHALMAFSFVTPYFPMTVLGVTYSLLAASLWPCVAFVVDPKALGTAYGVMQSIQNLGLALLFLSVGAVVDSRGYLALELYFLLLLSVALCSTTVLWFVDAATGGLLNMTKQERNERMAQADEIRA